MSLHLTGYVPSEQRTSGKRAVSERQPNPSLVKPAGHLADKCDRNQLNCGQTVRNWVDNFPALGDPPQIWSSPTNPNLIHQPESSRNHLELARKRSGVGPNRPITGPRNSTTGRKSPRLADTTPHLVEGSSGMCRVAGNTILLVWARGRTHLRTDKA